MNPDCVLSGIIAEINHYPIIKFRNIRIVLTSI